MTCNLTIFEKNNFFLYIFYQVKNENSSVANDIAWEQNKHHLLMKDIATKHQLKATATRELDAVHSHHLSLVSTIIQEEEERKKEEDDEGEGEEEMKQIKGTTSGSGSISTTTSVSTKIEPREEKREEKDDGDNDNGGSSSGGGGGGGSGQRRRSQRLEVVAIHDETTPKHQRKISQGTLEVADVVHKSKTSHHHHSSHHSSHHASHDHHKSPGKQHHHHHHHKKSSVTPNRRPPPKPTTTMPLTLPLALPGLSSTDLVASPQNHTKHARKGTMNLLYGDD